MMIIAITYVCQSVVEPQAFYSITTPKPGGLVVARVSINIVKVYFKINLSHLSIHPLCNVKVRSKD